MKNSKHTPGPWKLETQHTVKDSNDFHASDLQIWSKSEFIAVIPPSLVAKREQNATLIAAAPELLEALIDLVNRLATEDNLRSDIEKSMLNALSISQKARGE